MTTVVIGAGIIGIALACVLQRRGEQVVVVDKGAPGRGTSFGNLASIAVTEFMPASRPAIWKQMPGWLLDPEGPVRVRPGYVPQLVPWFLRFMAASRPAKLRELEAQGAALCARVHEDLDDLLADAQLRNVLSERGCLSLYTDEKEFAADREHIALLERFGFAHEVIGRQAIKALEPELSDSIGMAVVFPENKTVRDPYGLVVGLADMFVARGGRIMRGDVMDVEPHSGGHSVVLAGGERLAAAKVVVCAGVYSARLARKLGEPIPLETERGYHTQIMSPGLSLQHSIIWPARAFMVSPTAGGVRVGGTVEFAGLAAEPDYRRAKITVRRAREALPNLACENFSEWMGHRPALPDTVPIMSASARTPGLFYATGHGHLGLTLAATSARLMADLITGATPPIDMRPYRIDRF
jgi:D-amino-acid dehydrogenase